MTTCKRHGCNGTVVNHPHGRIREYCSDRCRIAVAQGRRLCARDGCQGVVRRGASTATRFCSPACAAKSGHGWRSPNSPTRGQILSRPKPTNTESWWTNPDTFYAEARRRYPETGDPRLQTRSKPIQYARESRA